MSALPQTLSHLILQTQSSRRPEITVYPVEAEKALIGHAVISPKYHLIVWLDLVPALNERLHLSRLHLIKHAAMIIVLMVIVLGFVHVLWFQRAVQLEKVAKSLGEGDLGARTQLHGRDELAVIGKALDSMAEKLQQDRERLRQTLRHLETVANASPVLFWTSALDKGCDWFNQRWLDYTGRTMAQEQGNGWTEGVHPDDFEYCMSVYIDAFYARQAFSMEYRLRRHDGEYRWLLDYGLPRFDADGRFVGYIGSCMDIHDKKLLQEELSSSETQYRYLFQQNPAPMLIYERDNLRLSAVNDAFLNQYGYRMEDALNLTLPDLYPEDEKAAIADLAETLHGHAEMGEWRHLINNGQLINVLVHSHDLKYQGKACRVKVITDITQCKQAETALLQRNRELEIFTQASIGRELAMIELKREINRLLCELGREPQFDPGFAEDGEST